MVLIVSSSDSSISSDMPCILIIFLTSISHHGKNFQEINLKAISIPVPYCIEILT